MGGQGVRMVPCFNRILHTPLSLALEVSSSTHVCAAASPVSCQVRALGALL